MEIFWGSDFDLCKMALQRTPIHFLGISYKAELRAVYDLEVGGLYKLEIVYGPYALHALLCSRDPELSLYFDYSSMLLAIAVQGGA